MEEGLGAWREVLCPEVQIKWGRVVHDAGLSTAMQHGRNFTASAEIMQPHFLDRLSIGSAQVAGGWHQGEQQLTGVGGVQAACRVSPTLRPCRASMRQR